MTKGCESEVLHVMQRALHAALLLMAIITSLM
jgi:hypothetical protein